MIARVSCVLALCCAVMMAGACNLFNDSSSPTTPSTTLPTETFSGTLAQNGSVVFTFTVLQPGSVAVTLTALSPASTGVGLGIGTLAGTNICTLTTSASAAIAAAAPQVTATETAGTYCVKVFDAGSLSATATFTVTILHS